MKLVENVKEVLFLHWSTKAMAASVALPALWMILPTDWQQKYFPDWLPQGMAYLTMGLGLLSIGLKLLKQDLPSDQEDGHIDLIKTPLTKSFPSDKE